MRAAGVERRAVEEDAHRLAREDGQLEPVARRRRVLERQPRQQHRPVSLRLLRLLRHGGPRGPVRVVEGGLGPVGGRGVGGEEAAGGGERGGRDGEGGGERVAEGGHGGDGQRVEADAAVVREKEEGEHGVGGHGPRHVLRKRQLVHARRQAQRHLRPVEAVVRRTAGNTLHKQPVGETRRGALDQERAVRRGAGGCVGVDGRLDRRT